MVIGGSPDVTGYFNPEADPSRALIGCNDASAEIYVNAFVKLCREGCSG